MSKIDNMTEKQPPSYPLRMPQELRERLAEVAKESGRSMNAEIVARLQESFHVHGSGSASMRITAKGEGNVTPIASSADQIADKVAERLDRMIVPFGEQALQGYMEILERHSKERHRKWWMEQFGYDPETPPVAQHGGAPVKSTNAKRSIKKT